MGKILSQYPNDNVRLCNPKLYFYLSMPWFYCQQYWVCPIPEAQKALEQVSNWSEQRGLPVQTADSLSPHPEVSNSEGLRQRCSVRGNSTPREHWALSGDNFCYHSWGGGFLHLAGRGWGRCQTLYTAQNSPFQQSIISPKMHMVTGLEKLVLGSGQETCILTRTVPVFLR
jgi:hypothetical protein